MKSAIIFVVGFALGAFTLWYGPKQIWNTAQKSSNEVVGFASQKRFESCREDFLKETSCFENEPQKKCESMVKTKCGDNPALTNEKEAK